MSMEGKSTYMISVRSQDSTTPPNEKIVFKDIPLSVNDKEILAFLNDQTGIVVKSGVIASRIRDNENKLTPFYI